MSRHRIPCLFALALAAPLAHADTAKTYIVQFVDTAVQAPVRKPVRDARRDADPRGWGYLDERVIERTQAIEVRYGIRARHAYSHAMKGFAARLTPAQLEGLRADPSVASIEEDQPMHAVAQSIPSGISQTRDTLSSTLAGDGSGTVTGVNVYVIDTGISAHPDLNLLAHVNFTGDGQNTDCNGHGSHVSGTIGARDDSAGVVGMAPGVALTGIKVLGCTGSGTTSGVIKGVDWVTANAVKPAVANMSLGGGASKLLDNAVLKSVSSGVTYALAAGNNAADACTQSPARTGKNAGAITVAAVDSLDLEATFSNYGRCVDTWAPGVSILSTYLNGGFAIASGTSMASPHVAGAAALYLSRYPASTPTAVESAIKATAVVPGTRSKDGSTITRLDVLSF